MKRIDADHMKETKQKNKEIDKFLNEPISLSPSEHDSNGQEAKMYMIISSQTDNFLNTNRAVLNTMNKINETTEALDEFLDKVADAFQSADESLKKSIDGSLTHMVKDNPPVSDSGNSAARSPFIHTLP